MMEIEWTCGHVAGSVCAECHLMLIRKANDLARENMALRELVDEALRELIDAWKARTATKEDRQHGEEIT